jgi:hypothetical protein
MGITDKPCHVMASNGIPFYIAWSMDALRMARASAMTFAQPLLLILTSILVIGFVAVEGLFGAALGPLIVFSLAVVSYSFSSKGKNKKPFEN